MFWRQVTALDLPIGKARLGAGFHAYGCFGVIIMWMSGAALHP